jgi:DNA-binding NtrC family response regulator
MKARGRILVVEDDEEMRNLLEDELRDARYEVLTAASGPQALERLTGEAVDVLVTDNIMPGMKGRELLTEVRAREPDLPVVIITAFGDVGSAVDAMRAGAYHYVTKPFRMEQLLATLEGALRERNQWRRLHDGRVLEGAGRFEIVAASPGMRRVLDLVKRASAADSPVLLLGESGTGKELLARALHAQGARASAPFIAVNCSAIPDTLLESQLFGHRRGAFTDAREDHRGLFVEADRGTIFLDEIGDMPAALQAKLLRVVQEREVHPLGSPAPVAVDVRVVAATHRDLDEAAEQGRFRRDLYYRLNVITVRIPPLRERIEDLAPLVGHFLARHGRRLGRVECTVTAEALEALSRHAWPGNVRELENVIERGLVLGGDNVIGLEDLPAQIRARPRNAHEGSPSTSLAEMEREHIVRTLRAVGGNRAAAARVLAVDRKTLYRKLKSYGIRLP